MALDKSFPCCVSTFFLRINVYTPHWASTSLPLEEGGGQGPVLMFSSVYRTPGGGSHTGEKAAEAPGRTACAADHVGGNLLFSLSDPSEKEEPVV